MGKGIKLPLIHKNIGTNVLIIKNDMYSTYTVYIKVKDVLGQEYLHEVGFALHTNTKEGLPALLTALFNG